MRRFYQTTLLGGLIVLGCADTGASEPTATAPGAQPADPPSDALPAPRLEFLVQSLQARTGHETASEAAAKRASVRPGEGEESDAASNQMHQSARCGRGCLSRHAAHPDRGLAAFPSISLSP